MTTTRTCVKIDQLRSKYNDKDYSLKKWFSDPNNIYVGRNGRIFINKEPFCYPSSIWHNPYKLKDHSLDESLKMYREYITEKIQKSPNMYDLNKLKGKNLGCFCKIGNNCHVDILIELIEQQDTHQPSQQDSQ
jgi:hypothetical protein